MSAPTPSHDLAAEVLQQATERVEDIHLEHVKTWKLEHPGRLAVGHLPNYIPRPLIEALGALPVAVFGGGDQVDIIRGDSYFQSYICHIPRSVIELGLARHYDVLDAMLFPSICDVVRNLGGMWKILFPKVYATYLDLPQNFDTAIGGKFYRLELERIATELTARGALPLEEDRLRQAIADENDRRVALHELDELRRTAPWLVPASEAYVVARAGSTMFAAEHAVLIRRYLKGARARDSRRYDNVRCILRGAFCEQPPLLLIRAIEKAGCDILDDDFQLGLRMLGGSIELKKGETALDALVGGFLTGGCATSSRYIGDDVKGRELVEDVHRLKADGVIFAAASFCDPALLDQPMLETALNNANIPYTAFKFSENAGQFQVIREQAGAFSDAVKLWGNEA